MCIANETQSASRNSIKKEEQVMTSVKIFIMLLLISIPLSISGQERATQNFTIPTDRKLPIRIARLESSPQIDGVLDEPIWESATVLNNFIQTSPGDNIKPSRETEVRIGYDSKKFYVSFRAKEDVDKIRATSPIRDQIINDDLVGIYLDTFNDQQRAYTLFFNAHGIQQDGIYTENFGVDRSIDIVMESKGTITSDGYNVEIAIPFKSLRYEAGKGKIWRAHFFRRIKWANNELDSWMPMSRNISGWLTQTGQLTGIENIETERSFELIPSLAFSETGKRVNSLPPPPSGVNDPGRMVNKPVNVDPGLTLKYNLTPAITIDAAINPDFAQVEADQPVVTANQRFPIFFEERRPFFFEGAEMFRTPIRAVHTRSIIDPDYALKLTGRRGKNNYSLLLASDNAPGNYSEEERNNPKLLPTITKFLDKNAYVGILRYRRSMMGDSNLGFLTTSYNFRENHNQVAGVDGRLRIDPTTIFSFQFLGSTSKKQFFNSVDDIANLRTGNGLAYDLLLNKSDRHFGYSIAANGRTSDFRTNAGFYTQTNTNKSSFSTNYTSEQRQGVPITFWKISQETKINYDNQGRLQSWSLEPLFNMQFQRQTNFSVGYLNGYEKIREDEFEVLRNKKIVFFGNSSERATPVKGVFGTYYSGALKKITVEGDWMYKHGELDFDYVENLRRVSPAALINPKSPMDPAPGKSLKFTLTTGYRPSSTFNTSLSYTKSRLKRNDTGLIAFDDNIYSWRTTYQFTRFLFIRTRVDYSSLNSTLRGQYLLGWTPNPGTAFYAGYNDRMSDYYERFRLNERTFFVKMSYLIRR